MHKQQIGFTLIELILVIILLGILSVISLPRFFNLGTFDSRFFINDLHSALDYSHKTAISSGCSVQFTLASSGFNLTTDTNCSTGPPLFTTDVLHPSDNVPFTGSIPNGLSVTSPSLPMVLVFTSDSTVEDNVGTQITNQVIQLNGNDINESITVHGSTGFVQ